ncbi:MAG: FtsX-like permease family protein [Eubacteriales bacterium]
MTKRRMFLRMITASLLRRRSRMLIALLSIGIGATILAGLVTIYVDVPRQMGAQFRSFGANMLILSDGEKGMSKAQLDKALENIPAGRLVGAAPYRYVRVDMTTRQQSFTAAGTDFDQITKTSPYFSIEGRYPENPREVLVGKEIAETIGIREGSGMELTWQPAAGETAGDPSGDRQPGAILSGSAEGWSGGTVYVTVKLDDSSRIASLTIDAGTQTPEIGGLTQTDDSFNSQFVGKSLPLTLGEDVDALSGATITSTAVVEALNTARNTQSAGTAKTIKYTVTGILATGGEEESYVFMSLEDMAGLTGSDAVDVAELSVSASAEELETYAEQITENTDGVRARLVKRVTRSETAVLGKLQSLVFLVTAVVLILTMICVSTTMMAVVSERRREIGLRKALGASDGSVRTEFLGEGMFLGLLGGILGAVLGFAFAQVVSVNVFGSSITFQPLLLPAAVIVSMGVAALSCLQPIKRAVAIDPAIVLKDE